MTSISRVFGLVRDVVVASLFGASLEYDAYVVAFRIPNFLRRIFGEGGFSQAFVPVLSEYKETRSKEEIQDLLDQTSATLGLSLLVTTIIGVLIAPLLISIFAIGWFLGDEYGKMELASQMLRITFPYLLFISLTAFAGGILNTYRQFAVPAFTPVLLNISLIICAIWLAPQFPDERRIVALAWGVLIAGIVQLFFQFPFLQRLGLFPKPGFKRDPEGTRRIIKLLIPVFFAISITQINLLVDTLIASFLTTGSISWLYYSDRLVEFPLGAFGIAIATVILPSLSSQHAKESIDDYNHILDWALRLLCLIIFPAAVGLVLLVQPILTTIFQNGEFTAFDVQMSGFSLAAYALGLPAFVLIKILASGFFSRQDTRTPVKIAAFAMICNIVINLILVGFLAHAGLALATSLSAYINAALLYKYLKAKHHYESQPGWSLYLLKVAVALVTMAVLLRWLVPEAELWLNWGVMVRVMQLALWILFGAACYFIVLFVLGLRPSQMTEHP